MIIESNNETYDKDLSKNYFESLCLMVEQLTTDELPINDINYIKRDTCEKCERPKSVCLCDYLPEKLKLENKVKIWIFQHPKEEKRCLRTTRILEKCLEKSNFEIIKAKRFGIDRFPQLKEVYYNPDTFVIYPSDTAISLTEFSNLIKNNSNIGLDDSLIKNNNDSRESSPTTKKQYHVILIDGTWAQASGIYYTNSILQQLRQIKIENIDIKSAYTIRTQPRESFLSTLETCSIILSTIEEKSQIYNDLVKPLEALCNFQFEHGAVPHNSKEFLIFNGLYKKPLSKKNFNKLTKNSKFLTEEEEGEEKEENILTNENENKTQVSKANYDIVFKDLVVKNKTTRRKKAAMISPMQ